MPRLAQSFVFVHYVWNKIYKDTLYCKPITRNTFKEIFKILGIYVKAKNLD